MKRELTEKEAYSRLADMCVAADYSTGETLERLRGWGITGRVAVDIVQHLVDERFIDDERFARAYVRSKVNHSGWGRVKIRHALFQKGIERELIDLAIDEEVDIDVYHSNLADALRSKARSMPDTLDADCRSRLLRFAVGRGYEPGLVMEMIPEEDFWRYEPDN
ncbi:MAG: RecX family transcriptional regulator [Muribaculaceae bacterium]|nr:RecX family transcriptional regulator [Muribaculaceae bacterium]